MTNQEVQQAFSEVYNNFWLRYRDKQPKEDSPEWERMHTQAVVLKRKYPLLEEAINRMVTEIMEREKGRGRIEKDFCRPPG